MSTKAISLHAVAAAVLCATAYVLVFPPGADSRAASCGQASAQTVVADSAARVYRVATGRQFGYTVYD